MQKTTTKQQKIYVMRLFFHCKTMPLSFIADKKKIVLQEDNL